MYSKTLDRRDRRGKRTSNGILRFLSRMGLLHPAADRSAERHDPRRPGERIAVWDARLGAFRDVDLDNRHDPLREPARQLASLRRALASNGRPPPVSAAAWPAPGLPLTSDVKGPPRALGRLSEVPPRSPFGGGDCVALGTGDG